MHDRLVSCTAFMIVVVLAACSPQKEPTSPESASTTPSSAEPPASDDPPDTRTDDEHYKAYKTALMAAELRLEGADAALIQDLHEAVKQEDGDAALSAVDRFQLTVSQTMGQEPKPLVLQDCETAASDLAEEADEAFDKGLETRRQLEDRMRSISDAHRFTLTDYASLDALFNDIDVADRKVRALLAQGERKVRSPAVIAKACG